MTPWAAFCDPDRVGTWKPARTPDEEEQRLVAYYLSQCCSEVVRRLTELGWSRARLAEETGQNAANVRRKLNGEYPATHGDLLRWAIALDDPEVLFAPGATADLLPEGTSRRA